MRMRAAGGLGDEARVTVERGDRGFASGDRVMFQQNERGLRVKNGSIGTIERVSTRSMTVQTDDGRSVRFDLKDYNRIDHGYAATIHKAQGMTVDRTHVWRRRAWMPIAAMWPCRGTATAWTCIMAATILPIRTGSSEPCRAPRQGHGLGLRARDPARLCRAARHHFPRARCRDRAARSCRRRCATCSTAFDRLPSGARPGRRRRPERKRRKGQSGGRPGNADASARTRRCVRHARAVDAIFDVQELGGKASPAQVKELQKARKVFEEVRPYGSHDAEAAYKKNPELVRETADGQVSRAILALQLETELRADPGRRAYRFVERWQKLDHTSQRQYRAGDMSGYKATRSAIKDMAKSLERDPQMEYFLANRKKELGIAFKSGRRLGQELAFTDGIDLGRGRGYRYQQYYWITNFVVG